ncbi:MAG: hypothetical protein JWO57_3013 [Pseudonocardiales bacterium]|nr:hypothetical protein [Pseudonocardiales bacterium]
MTTMVQFQLAGAAYAIPVQAVRGVRLVDGMIALPAPDRDVAGVIPGDPPLTVISPMGSAGTHILVIEVPDKTFGLLVDRVIGLRRVANADIGIAPRGQKHPLISGMVDANGELVLIADPQALAGHL